jgi:hypothetical protein
MQKLKHSRQAIIHRVKQAWLFPRSMVTAVKQWRRQTVLNEHEAERIDRIRNPSKYLGKG